MTNINFLLTISIQCQEIRFWESIKWSPKRKCFDLLSNSLNLFFKEMHRDQFGEFAGGYWGLKGYAISVWGNCSQSYLHGLDLIYASACRKINHLPSAKEDDLCLSRINWLPIDYIYKRHILLKMFHIFMGSAPSQMSGLFSKPSRPTRFSNQFNIIRINTEVGRSSFQ